MRVVQHTPHPSTGGRSYTPPSHVIAERERRLALDHDPVLDVVDLAKDPGLIYRLYAILYG
ncbi:hypothetical protein [Defluviimonas sp. SAOS-178_SWC]|uniref:hypothetical protein n=1 Tax=Defluviimonas sp. SAOS-178_SWC TaxID=3121287 RepID=UPI00322151F3